MVFNQIRRLFITLDATDKATRKLKGVNAAANRSSVAMQRSAQRAQMLRSRLVAVGFAATIVTGATRRMVGAVSQVTRTFSRVAGTSGATAGQMQNVREEAQRIGAEMPVAVGEAAEAFEELSFAGLSAEESISSANDVVELAIAGNIELGQAARTSGRAMNAFGLEAEELSQVTNSMAATFTNSALDMSELTQSLTFAQSMAQDTSQSIEELTAALGTMADNGLAASRAGTALERMFIELTRKSDELADAGIAVDELQTAEGEFRNLHEIVQVLGNDLEHLDSVARMETLQEIFGARGARAANLLMQNTDEFIEKIGDNARAEIRHTFNTLDDLSDEEIAAQEDLGLDISAGMETEQIIEELRTIEGSTEEVADSIDVAFSGISSQAAEILADDLEDTSVTTEELAESIDSMATAGTVAEAQMESLWGQIEFIRGSISSLTFTMVSGMLPVLNTFLEVVGTGLETLSQFPRVVRGLGLGFITLNAILVALTLQYVALIMRTKIVRSMFMETAGAQALAATTSRAHSAALQLLAGNYGLALQAMVGYNTAQAIHNNRKALAIVLTQGYAMATLRRASAQMYATAVTKAATVASYAKAAGLAVLTAAQWAYNNALTMGLASLGIFIGIVADAPPLLKAAAGAVMILSVAIYVLYNVITGGTINILYALTGAVAGLVAVIGGIVAAVDWDAWANRIDGAIAVVRGAVDALVHALTWLWVLGEQLMGLAIAGFFYGLSEAIAWTSIQLGRFLSWLGNLPMIGPAVRAAIGGMTAALNALGDASDRAGGIGSWLGDVWSRIGMAIGDSIRWMLPAIGAMILAWDWFASGVDAVVVAIGELIHDGLAWLRDGLMALWAPIDDLIDQFGILGATARLLVAPFYAAYLGIMGAWDLLMDGLTVGVNAVLGVLSTLHDWFVDTFPEAASLFNDMWEDLLGPSLYMLKSGLTDLWEILVVTGEFVLLLGDFFVTLGRVAGLIVAGGLMLLGDFLIWLGEGAISLLMGFLSWLAGGFRKYIAEPIEEYVMPVLRGMYDFIDDHIIPIMLLLGNAIAGAAVLIGFAIEPISTILVMLAGVVAVLGYVFIDNWEAIREAVSNAVSAVMPYVNMLIDGIMFLIDALVAIGGGFVMAVIGIPLLILGGILDWITDKVLWFVTTLRDGAAILADLEAEDIIDGMRSIGSDIVSTIASGIESAPGILRSALIGVLSGPFGVLMPSSDADEGPLSNLTSWGINIVKTLASGILSAPMAIANAVKDVVLGIPAAIGGAALSVGREIGSMIMGALGDVPIVGDALSFGSDVVSGVADGARGAMDKVQRAGGIAKDALTDPVGAARDAVDLGEDIAHGIGDGVKGATDYVANALSDIPVLGDAVGFVNQGINSAVNLGQDLVSGIADGIRGGISTVSSAVSSVTDTVSSATDMAGDALSSGRSYASSFAGGISDGVGEVGDAASSVASTVSDYSPFSPAKKGPLSRLDEIGPGYVQSFADGIRGSKDLLADAASEATGVLDDVMEADGIMSKGEELANGLAGGIASGASEVTGAVSDTLGAAESAAEGFGIPGSSLIGGASDALGAASQATSGVSDVGGAMDAAGNMARDAGGAVSDAAGGTPAQMAADIGGDTVNDITEDIDINFEGEVHDAQQIQQQVEEAVHRAKKEGAETIEDALDMGTDTMDSASDAVSDAAGNIGDVF